MGLSNPALFFHLFFAVKFHLFTIQNVSFFWGPKQIWIRFVSPPHICRVILWYQRKCKTMNKNSFIEMKRFSIHRLLLLCISIRRKIEKRYQQFGLVTRKSCLVKYFSTTGTWTWRPYYRNFICFWKFQMFQNYHELFIDYPL